MSDRFSLTVDEEVLFSGSPAEFKDRPPDFVKDVMRPADGKQLPVWPWSSAVAVVFTMAMLRDERTAIVVTTGKNEWSMDVKVRP